MSLVQQLEATSRAAGFDLVHPFAVDWYNARVAAPQRLHDFGRPGSLAVLLGNTRALWPVFTRAVQGKPLNANPLNRYTEATLARIASDLAPLQSRCYFAHSALPLLVPMQKLAELVGFAHLGPTQLLIHPQHGSWFGLRAVLVLDAEGPAGAPPVPERPCAGCPAPCLPALEHAQRVSGEPLTSRAIAQHAEAWIAVRDACPVGRASRYGEQQLRYHYAPDVKLLQGS